jgi:hypothetical protein
LCGDGRDRTFDLRVNSSLLLPTELHLLVQSITDLNRGSPHRQWGRDDQTPLMDRIFVENVRIERLLMLPRHGCYHHNPLSLYNIFIPSKLYSCFSSMTVRTSYFTFVYLLLYFIYGKSFSYHITHILILFSSYMI